MEKISIPLDFKDNYPHVANKELMSLYKVSRATLHRWARSLYISKTITRKKSAQKQNAKVSRKIVRNYRLGLCAVGTLKLKFAGIYKITCLINGKVYVGSALNISSRFRRHETNLYKNIHANKHLQNTYNKYGPNQFLYEVIEKVSDENVLIDMEQFWMDKLESTNPYKGFNLKPKASSMLGFRRINDSKNKVAKRWIITKPNGDVTEIVNLNQFCRDNNLIHSCLSVGSHKGYKCVKVT